MHSVGPRARGWSSVTDASARKRGKSPRRNRGRLTSGKPSAGTERRIAERGHGVHAERGAEAAPRDPCEPPGNDEQGEVGDVPERDALVMSRPRGRDVQQIARTSSGGEQGVVQSCERAERRRAAIPVGLGAGERPGVAERRVQIERVETDRGRQQRHRRQASERAGVAPAPEQHDECGHEREPEQPRSRRETSEHSRRDSLPARRGEKGAGGEGEEEAVGVERREHEADGVEGEVEDDVVRATRAEDRPRDLRQRPGGYRPGGQRDEHAGDERRAGQPGECVCRGRIDREERGRLRHFLVAVLRDLEEPACIPLREGAEEEVARRPVGAADQAPVGRGRPDDGGRCTQPERDANRDERRGRP